MIDLEYGVTITPMFIQSIDQITFITGLGYLSVVVVGYHS